MKEKEVPSEVMGVSPPDVRKMTLAHSYRDEAAYLLHVDPKRYKDMAQKRVQEAQRLENQVLSILRDEE